MWEVIENSTRGADGSARRGCICSTKWCKHNTQGVRDSILPCDDSTRGSWGDLSWTNCEIVHVSRSFGQGYRGEKGWWGRRGLVTGGPGGLWEGAVVSLPTELHSDVSRCLSAHKNGTKCFSLWNSMVAYRCRSPPPYICRWGPPPCSCVAFRRCPGKFPQWLFGARRQRGKREGRGWDNTTLDDPVLLTRLPLRSTQLCGEQL